MPTLRPGRLRTVLSIAGVLILVSTIYLNMTPTPGPASVVPSTAFEVPLTERQNSFWKVLKPILETHAPGCPSPTRERDAGSVAFNATAADSRPEFIHLGDGDFEKMEAAHAGYVQNVTESKKLRPVHSPGTRGLVSTAGGPYLPVFLASLRMLRRAGSTLPVEVYMKDADEHEKSICEDILADLGARCLILSHVVGKDVIEPYQLKTLAVLFSSFEEVIWMDADCFFLDKPEILLNNDPFASTGMVTWPDFWANTVSPTYFNISGQTIPPMTERQSTDAGVFMISKKTHYRTLLLAVYYNFYGPSHYFQLLSQGAPGEGDKDTFLHAASAMGEPFYAVSERIRAIGHPYPDGFSGSAIAQSDPIGDHALTSQDKWRVKDPSVDKAPRVFFIHANYPKFNPAENIFGSNWETTPTLRADGTDGRAWTAPEDVIKRLGSDAERAYWEELKWVSCTPEVKFKAWKAKSEICNKVSKYWDNVFAEPHEDDPKFFEEG